MTKSLLKRYEPWSEVTGSQCDFQTNEFCFKVTSLVEVLTSHLSSAQCHSFSRLWSQVPLLLSLSSACILCGFNGQGDKASEGRDSPLWIYSNHLSLPAWSFLRRGPLRNIKHQEAHNSWPQINFSYLSTRAFFLLPISSKWLINWNQIPTLMQFAF